LSAAGNTPQVVVYVASSGHERVRQESPRDRPPPGDGVWYNSGVQKPSSHSRHSRANPTYWGADVPMSAIRRLARQVAEQFRPEKIVLFGSHAYGTPHADSDVDILVIAPARNRHGLSVKIRLAVPAPFPMDLIVRTPTQVRAALSEGALFLTEILTKGKALYEAGDRGMGAQGRARLPRGRRTTRSKAATP
jgi:predicted nucleotidyltransferase